MPTALDPAILPVLMRYNTISDTEYTTRKGIKLVMATKIPVAFYKGKYIVRVKTGYVVKGQATIHKTLLAATDSI